MSRFVEILNNTRDIAIKNISKILLEVKRKLKAKTAHLEVEFPISLRRRLLSPSRRA